MQLQEEARRLAEQVRVLEDTRSRWNAEAASREASLAAKEEALAADSRQMCMHFHSLSQQTVSNTAGKLHSHLFAAPVP